MEYKEIYIIGAGISGLLAAYELEQQGFHPVVLEKTSEVGGRVKTIQEEGFALDIGFQVLLDAYPLAKKYLDFDTLELQQLESGAMIYANNKSYRIGDPTRNWKILFPTLIADIGSFGDKLKILKLNRKLKKKSIDEIFQTSETTTEKYLLDFGFSSKIIEKFFKPFFAGIFLEPDLKTSSRMFEFVYKMFGEGNATIPKQGIGAISQQLKNKLNNTEFIFNCDVQEVTNEEMVMGNGDKKSHQGVIVTSNASSLIPNLKDQEVSWKSCRCFYFEVNQTNIPAKTIALVADPDKQANNLYAYEDPKTGKQILSVTTIKESKISDQELLNVVNEEVKYYTGASNVKHIQNFHIQHALPDLKNIKMSAPVSESQLLDNIFLAGDYLFNGSLNAAMESGRLAAESIVQKKKGTMPG